jgi:hypothetical protein
MQRLLAQAAHSVLLVETHRLLFFFFPVSRPCPFPSPLGSPLERPKPSPAGGFFDQRARSQEPATLRGRELAPWRERRAQEKAERPRRARARAGCRAGNQGCGRGEVCANSPAERASEPRRAGARDPAWIVEGRGRRQKAKALNSRQRPTLFPARACL